MPTDKKISELPVATSINGSDVSVLVDSNTDYQYTFTLLLQFLEANLSVGAGITFGTTLPQNTTGSNGDVFVNTAAGTFAQKIAGTWTIVYTLPAANAADGTLLYGAGLPGSSTGKPSDSYINTLTGIFYQKSSGIWAQVFSMATGPQGPPGTPGTNGTNGVNGNTILFGLINPSNTSTGINGDFYINTNTYVLFGPKTAGVWGDGVPLIGAGIATGGTTGQVLVKAGATDYDTAWQDNSFANLTGSPGDNANLATALAAKENAFGFTPENAANKSTNTALGTSDVLFPSQNAVKVYVDSTLTAGISGIAAGGDLSGTYPNPTVNTLNGISKTYYDPTSSIQTQLNGKQGALTLTTTGSSGAATLTGSTLNIPQYSGGGGSSIYSTDGTLTGNRTVTMSGNTFTLSDTNPAISFSNPSYSGNYATSLGLWSSFGHLILGNNGANYIQGGTSATGGSLHFFTNCTNAFGVTPNGNLALTLASTGNASFAYDLTVSGALSVTGSTTFGNVQFGTSSGGAIITSTGAGSNAVYQKISNNGGNAYIGLSNSTGGGLLGTASAYALNIQTESARDIVFGTNNAENMRLFSSGNFVIGQHTDVSSSKFTVAGSTTQGSIPWTQMTTSQRTAISSPAEGLAVYDLTLHKLYVYDGTAWQAAW